MDEDNWDTHVEEPREKERKPVKKMTIFDAIIAEDVETVEKLLNENSGIVNSRRFDAKTPLEVAVELDSGIIIRLLISKGANVHMEGAARCPIIEHARNIGKENIFDLLDTFDRTNWSPGEDPDLLLLPRDNDGDMTEALEMQTMDKDQVSLILEDIQMEKHAPLFDAHRLSYIEFLRMDDSSLRDIGICSKEDRAKIVEALKAANTRKWKKSDSFPRYMIPQMTSSEAIVIQNNLTAHCNAMAGVMQTLKNHIVADPNSLRNLLEKAPIEDIKESAANIFDEIEKFKVDVQNLASIVRKTELREKQVSEKEDDDVPKSGNSRIYYSCACATAVVANVLVWAYLYFHLK